MNSFPVMLRWIIKATAILFAASLSHPYPAQIKSKQQAPREKLLRQIHPEIEESDPPKGIGLLTGYKIPKHVEFRVDLPRTNVGKILRRALKEGA